LRRLRNGTALALAVMTPLIVLIPLLVQSRHLLDGHEYRVLGHAISRELAVAIGAVALGCLYMWLPVLALLIWSSVSVARRRTTGGRCASPDA